MAINSTVTVEVFRYEDLTDEAKEVARERERETLYQDPDTLTENIQWEIHKTLVYRLTGEIYAGWGDKNERVIFADLDIEFSLSNSQGDGVAFYGIIRKDVAPKLPWPENADYAQLTRVAGLSNHYSHYNTFHVDVFDADDSRIEGDELEEFLRDLSRECERNGYQAIDDTLSDENITDSLENVYGDEYRYLEDGRLAPIAHWRDADTV
jgi:hypothetical protein